MDHDWMQISAAGEDEVFVCKRCGAEEHWWETNIPCGTRTRHTHWKDGKVVEGYPRCVERDDGV